MPMTTSLSLIALTYWRCPSDLGRITFLDADGLAELGLSLGQAGDQAAPMEKLGSERKEVAHSSEAET